MISSGAERRTDGSQLKISGAKQSLAPVLLMRNNQKMGDDVNGYYRVVITSGEKMLLRYVNIDDYKPVVMGVIDVGLDDIKDLVSESKDLKDAKDAKNALENLLNIYHKFNDTLDKYIAMKEIQEKLDKLIKGE